MKGWSSIAATGHRSVAVAVAWLVGSALWAAWPVWDSLGVPDREQVRLEAPWVLTAQISGLVLLAVTMRREAGRRIEPLAAVASLVVADCVLRAVLTPGTAGVEVVHALPLLAGAGLGLAAGVLTGAGAAIASTVLVATPAETLPAQCLVWALVGASGALLRRLPTVVAWLAAVLASVAVGIASGVGLNLIGWGQETGGTTTHFVPGLPPTEVLARLWAYTAETSLAYDTVRGLTTALVVAVLGLPVLRMLRGPSHTASGHRPTRADHDLAAAIRRREDSSAIARLWAVQPVEQEKK
ncbi:hypothetical protein [Nocardioides jishulii]|uniref:ECF transporter S component n=1 Tax=Nocardioides jishulii TaxID=2575440 RepID=A0A4U2YMA4_9ACTN|nr:hypothetical protein [Nocardioides jishulii]QCX28237.1 hypothetical protein FCL41_12430 [Nocardioides jishulii]TKI60901.1 hypothetical protein FC770_15500 [Nocardioides jishulii]